MPHTTPRGKAQWVSAIRLTGCQPAVPRAGCLALRASIYFSKPIFSLCTQGPHGATQRWLHKLNKVSVESGPRALLSFSTLSLHPDQPTSGVLGARGQPAGALVQPQGGGGGALAPVTQ